jgi:hypothetical protein
MPVTKRLLLFGWAMVLFLRVFPVAGTELETRWLYKTKITVSGYDKPETLTNFPVLIRFGPSITNFSYRKFGSPTDAADLRIVAADGVTALDYEIEKWDTNNVTATLPTNVPGCILWLKADAGVQTNAGGWVTGWQDQSGCGNGAWAPSGSEPTLVAGGLNGKPFVRFDGITNCLRNTSWAPGFNVSSQLTYFFVSKVMTNGGASGFFGQRASTLNDHNNNQALSIEQNPAGNGGIKYYHNTNPDISVLRNNSMFRIDVLRADASGTQAYLDGLAVGISANGFAGQLNPIEYAIGARALDTGISGYGRVDFGEILIYTNALTTDQMCQVGEYLAEKYGLDTLYTQFGESYVWVKIPALTNNTSMWAYWGNSQATVPPSCTTNCSTWDTNYFRAVWHMGHTNIHDSTVYTNEGTASLNATFKGLIGDAQRFNGNSPVNLTNRPPLNILYSITISAWLTHFADTSWCFAYSAGNTNGWSCDYGNTMSHAWGLECSISGGGGSQMDGTSSMADMNTWHHLVFVYDYEAGKAFLYENGIQTLVTNKTGTIRSSDQFFIGAKHNLDANYRWNGYIDEMRISPVASSSNWIWACWLNQVSNSVFNSYGCVENTARGSVMMLR